MTIHHHRRITAHGYKVKKPKRHINAGITVHGKPGAHMHKYQLPGLARQDAWKRRAQAQGQG